MLIVLGAVTIFIAGGSALKELDIKKVIALSTLRQLGVMFFSLGLVLPSVAFFHLASHAYFKAMLFISAGSLIHSFNDYQDIRIIGKGGPLIPFSLSIVLTAKLRLIGLPFLSGFYSKDLILEIIIMREFNIIIFLVAIMATALTVLYSIRFFLLVLNNQYPGPSLFSLEETDLIIMIGILFLLIPSIAGGLTISWSLLSFDRVVFLPL